MIASYYRSRIWLQGSHTGHRIMSYRQLRVKDLPKVPTWRLEVESNQWPSAPKTTLPTTPLNSSNILAGALFAFNKEWRAEVLGCPGPTRFLDARGRTNPKRNSVPWRKTKFFDRLLNFSREIFDSLSKISEDIFSHFSHLPKNFPVFPKNFFNFNLYPNISDDLFSHLPFFTKLGR